MSSQKKKKKNKNRNGGVPARKHIEAEKTTAAASADRAGEAEDTGTAAGSTEPEAAEDTKAAEVKLKTAEAAKAAEGSPDGGEVIEPETAGNTAPEAEIKKEHSDPEADKPESGGNESKERKGIRGAKKAVLIIAIVLLVLLLLLVGAYFALREYINERFLNKINYETTGESLTVIENIPTQTEETLPEQQTIDNLDEVEKGLIQADAKTFFNNGESADANYITNILLIGSDVRPGKDWNGNSDAMILVSINNVTGKVVMTSFMRDMYVYIPVIDTCSKLNAAHAYGGSELLCQTITGAFKIKVDKYIRVDFYGLMDIIDAAGGVDMLVTEEELPVLNKYITDMCRESGTGMLPDGLYLEQAGNVHLTGMQAVAYARIRYVGNSDFERTNRQRKVLGELVNNCKKMNMSQLTRLADVALPRVSTNMSRDEVWDMVNDAVKYMGYDVEMQRVPFDGTFTAEYINYQQVILPDYVQNVELMIKGIYGE